MNENPPSAQRSLGDRLRGALDGLLLLVFAILAKGPTTKFQDDHDAKAVETLLTWPARVAIVIGSLAVGWVWTGTAGGIQLGWALRYGLFVAVSIVRSFWLPILLVNGLLAILWLAVARSARAPSQSDEWGLDDVITWSNRQLSHVEAYGTWLAVAIIWSPRLIVQLPFVAAVLALGGPIINWIATWDIVGGKRARDSRAGLIIERRPVIYGFHLLGLVWLGAQALDQVGAFLPLVASAVPGLLLRYERVRKLRKHEEGAAKDKGAVEAGRLARAQKQQKAAPWFGPVFVLAAFAGIFAWSVWQTGRLERASHDELDGPPPSAQQCAREVGGPVVPTLAMFLLADTQVHSLGGKRFPGQMEIASALVPVARRPVELDTLSAANVNRYKTVFAELAAAREKTKGISPLLWAHLGDFVDLSCVDEMSRMMGLLGDFGGQHKEDKAKKRLAGVAPGNHDSSFTGNFGWSPYWSEACAKKGRLEKAESDQAIEGLFRDHLVAEGKPGVVTGIHPTGILPFQRGALFTVTRLGTIPAADRGERGVVAIFIDTADKLARDFGIAGTFGTFSPEQRDEIRKAVGEVQAMGGAWADPWFVLFGHHPYGEMVGSSSDRLAELIEELDRGPSAARGGEAQPRVVALITAHTHHAESHRHCVGHRLLREIIVGSVIDPPQQAALLEIGLDAQDRVAVRVSTLPAVARPGMTCGSGPVIDAAACHRVTAALAADPACGDLVNDEGDDGGGSCEELESPLPFEAQLRGLVRHGGPDEPDQIAKAERRRALSLHRCLCRAVDGKRPEGCDGSKAPQDVDDRNIAVIERLSSDPARQTEMTCLAWAAGAVQAHKANGMTMAGALRCAFNDPTLPAAQVTVAIAEDTSCR